jgi:TolA-binding protein
VKSNELEEAFSALREETSGREPRARATLARVLVTTRRASRRRFRLLKLWLPIAAVLVASTAWAAASGRLDGLLPKAPVLDPTVEIALPASADTEGELPRALELAPTSATAAPEQQPALTSAASSVLVSSSEPAGPSPLALDKAAYEAAYRAHAKTSNGDAVAAAAAVAAWDRYIAQFPEGRFLPEARYARAVSLARAGRQGEAKQAMEPFVKGDGYRKADAERWIQSLEQNK